MATGLPIVPIVIRNADSVAGRNSTTLNPGIVDVAVLPPVSVEDWTLRNLRERIDQVRAQYLATLADWPAGGRGGRTGGLAGGRGGRAGPSS
jgi:putative phosphoserine phosphatase / 1-acylglycerol-3-phosphate O-acyltransferase